MVPDFRTGGPQLILNPALTGLVYHYEWSDTLAADRWEAFTPANETASGASPVESARRIFARLTATRLVFSAAERHGLMIYGC